MARFSLAEIARVAGGRIAAGDPDLAFEAYGIDSRAAAPGELFFALSGRRDGHEFVGAAAAAGAAGAVVSRDVPLPRSGFGLVRVEDTTAALQALGREALRRRPVRVVGITGSAGKTTTKEFAAEVLSSRLRVLKSAGNLNNHLGLPLSLLRLEDGHEAAVLEMGMSAPGEIAALTRLAPPDVAVITNIHPVHLEFFAGLREIALAKKEILDGAGPLAAAVLNGDDPLVLEISAGRPGRRILFGTTAECEVRALDVRAADGGRRRFVLVYGDERSEVELPFVNSANLMNALAAAAVGRAFDLPLADVAAALARLRPQAGRGVFLETAAGIRVYDDTYNSNPRALEIVLRDLGGLAAGRRVAILADMLELGPRGPEFHREAGAILARTGWDVLVAVGPLAAEIARGAAEAGLPPGSIARFTDAAAAAAAVRDLVRAGDLVLIKGSRGMRLETVVRALAEGMKE